MPKQSETGNVKKLCGCGRAKWSGSQPVIERIDPKVGTLAAV
jgi:hypothetical protein